MKRIIFVNLHANEFLVKKLNKILFKRSAAIKHKYFLDYLHNRDDIEVCNYINSLGFSLYHNWNKFSKFVGAILARLENRYILKKNGIPYGKVKIVNAKMISNEDIVISYLNGSHTLYQISGLKAFKAASAFIFLERWPF